MKIKNKLEEISEICKDIIKRVKLMGQKGFENLDPVKRKYDDLKDLFFDSQKQVSRFH